MAQISLFFRDRLVFGTFGFASAGNVSDFEVLRTLAKKAKENGVTKSFFQYGLDSDSLRSTLSTLVTSLTQTSLRFSSLKPAGN
eukprot:Awhi_evm2s14093